MLGPAGEVLSFFLLPGIIIGAVLYVVFLLTRGREPSGSGPAGAEGSLIGTLYTLAVAVLIAAFVGFRIEVFYPAPQFPFGPGAPPPPEATTPEGPAQNGPPPGYEEYQEALAERNRIASPVAIGAAVLILVAGLIPAVGRLPSIGNGVTLGGVLTLFYGIFLALQAGDELLRFLAVAAGLLVVLIALYLKYRPGGTAGA